jgi:hypothetical protein
MRGYVQFADENEVICADEAKCAMYYYYEMRRHGIANSDSLCWPQIAFSFDDGGEVSASLRGAAAGSVKPIGRHHFIEAFEYGNETYMRSTMGQFRRVFAQSQPVECKLKEEFLIAVEIPDSDEDGDVDVDEDDSEIEAKALAKSDDLISVGTELEAKFHLSTKVTSTDGAHDNLCRQELGKEEVGSAPGFYSDIVLESITAL